MTRLKAYLATKFFPVRLNISRKEYETQEEALNEEEFRKKYEAVDDGLGSNHYYHIISKRPEEDDLNTLLLFEIYEKLSSLKRQEIDLLTKQVKLQTDTANRLKTILTIIVVLIILSVVAAIILSL